jgi:hypothetical protein
MSAAEQSTARRISPWMTGSLKHLAAAALLAFASACGPGLGGTGTGATEDSLASFGAQSASVCQSDFADLLPCTSGGAAPLTPSGDSRWFAESEPASRLLLELTGNEARLQLRCAPLEFTGAWGVVSGQSARYYGRISAPGADEQRAMLLAARSAEGLTLQLLAADGRVLYSNLALRPVAAATSAASCP